MAGIDINYNAAAVNAYNNLDATNTSLSQVVSQLSSGLQIQTAADNPSGYVVGQYLQEEGNGYTQAISNVQTAVSVLQTAQGALGQEAAILQTMNTLATQVANGGTQSATTLSASQAEFASLQSELDQISASTNFGGTALLNGSYAGETFQVGPYNTASDQIVITIASSSSTALGVNSTAVSIGTVSSAEAAMTAVQSAISTVALQAAHANLVDVNVAQATTQFASLQILEQAGMSVLYQAQQLPNLAQKILQ